MQTGAMISAQQREVNEYFRQAAEYWSDVYSRTEVHGVIYQERRARVLALIDALCLPRTANVLEIGCGAGLTSVELAKRGYEVTAVDAVEAMLESTRKLAAEAGVADRLATRIADLRNLPFPEGGFQLVFAIGVLPWLPEDATAVAEMARVLASQGRLIVTADHRWGIHRVLDPLSCPLTEPLVRMARRIVKRPHKARARMSSMAELDRALRGAGLAKQASSTVGFGPFTLFYKRLLPESAGVAVHGKMQRLADGGFPVLRWAGAQYLVVAKKQ